MFYAGGGGSGGGALSAGIWKNAIIWMINATRATIAPTRIIVNIAPMRYRRAAVENILMFRLVAIELKLRLMNIADMIPSIQTRISTAIRVIIIPVRVAIDPP